MANTAPIGTVFIKGRTFFNGLDLFTTYGLKIDEKGYNSIISYPPLKAVPFNDWPEENGIEVDLSNPVLDTRIITIPFISTNYYGLRSFYNMLKADGYCLFHFNEIGYSWVELRMIGQGDLKVLDGKDQYSFSIIFSDDFPLRGYAYQPPQNTNVFSPEWDYYVTDLRMSEYGIRILQGTNAEILKMPQVKQRLTYKSETMPGIATDYSMYGMIDTRNLVAQSKEVTMQCLMTADTIPIFWRNYYSFLYDLKRPGPRYFEAINLLPFVNECFYKRSTVNYVSFELDQVWCQFSLTLEFNNFAIDLMGA